MKTEGNGGIFLKKTILLFVFVLLVLPMSLCAAKSAAAKEAEAQAAAQAAALAKVQAANALCKNFECHFDEEEKAYLFQPKPEVIERLSGKAATVIPYILYPETDPAPSFRLVFSYAGLEWLELTEATIQSGGRTFAFAIPEGASKKEEATGFVTEDYMAAFDGDILDALYDAASGEPTEETPDRLRLTGKSVVERSYTAYDKALLKEAIDIYRALQKEND